MASLSITKECFVTSTSMILKYAVLIKHSRIYSTDILSHHKHGRSHRLQAAGLASFTQLHKTLPSFVGTGAFATIGDATLVFLMSVSIVFSSMLLLHPTGPAPTAVATGIDCSRVGRGAGISSCW